jgi:hypothetical protein
VHARSFVQGKNKKEIMLMTVVHQVFPVQHLLNTTYTEPGGIALLFWDSSYMSDWNALHFGMKLHYSNP